MRWSEFGAIVDARNITREEVAAAEREVTMCGGCGPDISSVLPLLAIAAVVALAAGHLARRQQA